MMFPVYPHDIAYLPAIFFYQDGMLPWPMDYAAVFFVEYPPFRDTQFHRSWVPKTCWLKSSSPKYFEKSKFRSSFFIAFLKFVENDGNPTKKKPHFFVSNNLWCRPAIHCHEICPLTCRGSLKVLKLMGIHWPNLDGAVPWRSGLGLGKTSVWGFHSHGGTPVSLDGLFHGKCHEHAWVGGTFSGNLHVTTERWRLMSRVDWRFFAVMAKKTGNLINLEVKSKGANINPYHMTSQNWFIFRIWKREFWTAQNSDGQVIGVTGNWEVGLWDYLQKIHLSFIYLVIIDFDDIFEAFSILNSWSTSIVWWIQRQEGNRRGS